MKPAAFDYVRADSAEAAVAFLAQHGDEARILAGGQSLMAVLNMRLAQPALLIDISQSRLMRESVISADGLLIGASATQAEIAGRPNLAAEVPLLAQAFPHISHVQIQNRGTVCGSVAHADPSAELPLVLLALRGEVLLQSKRGSRTVSAQDFITGMLTTTRRADELVRSVRYPLATAGTGYAFGEFSVRHGDYAACAVAAVVHRDGIRIAIGGVADCPTARDWPLLRGSALEDALNELAWDLEARDDPQVSAQARRHLVRRLGLRVIEAARDTMENPS